MLAISYGTSVIREADVHDAGHFAHNGVVIAIRTEVLLEMAEMTRAAYNAAAERYHELFHDELAGKPCDLALIDRFTADLERGSLVLDAGCGPCGHVGRRLFDHGIEVIGIDVSDRCVELAGRHNPGIEYHRADIGCLPFPDGTFAGVIAWYSLIDTPSSDVQALVDELARVLKPGGRMLLAVKAGTTEGFVSELLGVPAVLYFTCFSERDVRTFLAAAGLEVELLETRAPYPQEISIDRIFAVARRR